MAESAATLWTIGTLLQWTQDFLSKKGIESPRLDAQVLLAHVLGCSKSDLYVRFSEEPSEPAKAKFRELIRRRVEGVPVAYLIGKKEFFLLSFEVSPDVLIPRPATESLVLAALERLKGIAQPRVLDVGCGSGCIGISIAHRIPSAHIVAIDCSAKAAEMTMRNAKRHAVESRVNVRVGDLFAPLNSDETFDLIVSNPPYIPTAEIATLAIEVREHEPRTALDGGADGFTIIDRLIPAAAKSLRSARWLLLEVGAGQVDRAMSTANALGFVAEKPIEDGDRILRVVVARKK